MAGAWPYEPLYLYIYKRRIFDVCRTNGNSFSCKVGPKESLGEIAKSRRRFGTHIKKEGNDERTIASKSNLEAESMRVLESFRQERPQH